MSLRVMPNVERLTFEYLRGVTEVATLVAQRVFTAFDPSRGLPQVVVSRFAGRQDQYQWLDVVRLQIEVWADKGGRPDAEDIMQVVRGAMAAMVGSHTLGTVTKVEEVNMGWLPDTLDTGGIRWPRYMLDVRVWAAPIESGS